MKSIALLSCLFLATVSCTTSVTGVSETNAIIRKGVPGGDTTETTRVTATVTKVDPATRKVTLVTPKGESFTVTAGPAAVNFSQIRTGDQFEATLTDRIVARLAKPGENISDDASAEFESAPRGGKPKLVTTETYQVVGTVKAIDLKNHKATLEFSDGSRETFTARKDVDLTAHKPGERVVIRFTETFSIVLK